MLRRRQDIDERAGLDAVDPDLEAFAQEVANELAFVPGRHDWLPTGDIEPHPRNPNEGDLGALAQSVDTVGFYGLVLVQDCTRTESGKYRILDGEHRWLDLCRREAPRTPCWIIDVDSATALRILAGANRINRLGQDRAQDRLELLRDLAVTELGLTGTGYDGDDLDLFEREASQSMNDALENESRATTATSGGEGSGMGRGRMGTHSTCPNCGHTYELGGV